MKLGYSQPSSVLLCPGMSLQAILSSPAQIAQMTAVNQNHGRIFVLCHKVSVKNIPRSSRTGEIQSTNALSSEQFFEHAALAKLKHTYQLDNGAVLIGVLITARVRVHTVKEQQSGVQVYPALQMNTAENTPEQAREIQGNQPPSVPSLFDTIASKEDSLLNAQITQVSPSTHYQVTQGPEAALPSAAETSDTVETELSDLAFHLHTFHCQHVAKLSRSIQNLYARCMDVSFLKSMYPDGNEPDLAGLDALSFHMLACYALPLGQKVSLWQGDLRGRLFGLATWLEGRRPGAIGLLEMQKQAGQSTSGIWVSLFCIMAVCLVVYLRGRPGNAGYLF